jgi:disulfide bond formation protein DsbB
MSNCTAQKINALGLLALIGILATSLFIQLVLGELPCPLCIVQRAAFISVGVALTFNLIHGPDTRHYGMVVVGSLVGMMMSIRQVFLHICPVAGESSGYGAAFFGYHLYSLGAIAFFLSALIAGVMMMFDKQLESPSVEKCKCRLKKPIIWVFGAIILVMFLLTLFECGVGVCPDNPVKYLWL